MLRSSAVLAFAVVLVAGCGGSVNQPDTSSASSTGGTIGSGGSAGASGGSTTTGGTGGGAAGTSSGGTAQAGGGGSAQAGGTAGGAGGSAQGGSSTAGAPQGGAAQGGSGQAGGAQGGAGAGGATSTCGPSSCNGCCDPSGACRPGDAANACGKGGVLCTACDAIGLGCAGDHCEGPKPACSAATCAGCCDAAGDCRFGTETDACGASGAACVDCATQMQGCVMGACQGAPPPCGPDTCGGCCDANGACRPGDSDAACGAHGASCQTCTTNGSTCVTPANYCAYIPPCDSTTCPSGCCDAQGICRGGNENDACGASGGACTDCSATMQSCAPQGFCYAGKHCGPDNCAGCCTLTGDCMGGSDPTACGQYGQVCDNCSAKNATCSGFVCSTGATCPAAYGSCNPGATTTPPTYATTCSTTDLDALQSACANNGSGCIQAFQDLYASNPSCYGCISQFVGNDGYARCLAPYLSAFCNHELTCAVDCSQSCDKCSMTDMQQCQSDVFANGGECEPYLYGYYCSQAALMGPATFCDYQAAGNDGGQWVKNVGMHYCHGG